MLLLRIGRDVHVPVARGMHVCLAKCSLGFGPWLGTSWDDVMVTILLLLLVAVLLMGLWCCGGGGRIRPRGTSVSQWHFLSHYPCGGHPHRGQP